MTTIDENKQNALRYAEQVAAALKKKLPNYNVFVRLIEAADYNFIELGLRANGASVANETPVAYSQMYFEGMSDPVVKQTRAKRIFADVKILLGIVDPPDAQ